MERCAGLIQKLREDFENNATPEQLLVTLQILQKELLAKTAPSPYKKSTKVSVLMPNLFQTYPYESTEMNLIEKEHPVAAPMELKENIVVFTPDRVTENLQQPEKEIQKLILIDESEEDDDEDAYGNIPTVAQQNNAENKPVTEPEVHQNAVMENALFSEHTTEESNLDFPLKDLKKGIGVNDRFLFIKELFRGDEVMYERSIKTINSFNIYPEAQYWIERELKIKLGWNDDNEVIQMFYNLVKRRFSVT